MLFHCQEYENACHDFKQAVSINRNHFVFRLRYGIALAALARKEDNKERCEEALHQFNEVCPRA